MSMSTNGTGGDHEEPTMDSQDTGRRHRRRRRKKRNLQRDIGKDRDKQEEAAVLAFEPTGRDFRSLREVAAEMGESVPAVVTLLQEAFRNGIFSVLLHLRKEAKQKIQLEAALRRIYGPYGVREVLLVEGVDNMLDDLDPQRRRAVHNMVIRSMAQRLARYLDDLVKAAARRQREASKRGAAIVPFRLGVAWGRTCHMLAEHLLATMRSIPPLAMEVLPIIGATSTSNTERVEAVVIAMDIAEAYGAVSRELPCPAVVQARMVDVVTSWPQIAEMLELIRKADVVITSMGPILDNPEDVGDIRLSNDPQMNRGLSKAARDAGAIGEINYWCFGPRGNVVWTPNRAIGLGLAGLQDIVKDAHSGRKVVLVCGGDKRRLEPLRVALRAGFASVLVTDTVTARYLAGENGSVEQG
jgi:DNA-binding transcriptional regulator LsrR (DeoR family)